MPPNGASAITAFLETWLAAMVHPETRAVAMALAMTYMVPIRAMVITRKAPRVALVTPHPPAQAEALEAADLAVLREATPTAIQAELNTAVPANQLEV